MSLEGTTIEESGIRSNDRAHARRWPRAVRFTVLPLIVGFFGMSALLAMLRFAPLPTQDLASPTQVVSADGAPLSVWTLRGSRDEQIPLAGMPTALVAATLAVEDQRFFRHYAFDFPALARALWVDARSGRVREGGSTITQQLAKNLYLNQNRTLGRKLREGLYALQLELHESKRAILEQYLNVVYYGQGAYGAPAAAETYFRKPVAELTVAESALLAGLPNGPEIYSPLRHLQSAKLRQHWVLQRLVTTGRLSQAQADAAWSEPLRLAATADPQVQKAPYFTGIAIAEAQRKLGLSSEDLYHGDTTIVSTLDPLLQTAAEQAVATTLPQGSKLQAAVVAIDPRDGSIRALVGGRNFVQSPYNRAFAERQPGSTFKAILYSTALEQGWLPTRQVPSELTTFVYDRDKTYTVHDYDDEYAHRPLTLREALARSDNVYAVTANLEVGPAAVVRLARAMGVTSPLQPYPSLALGVFPTSPLQMAAAYAVLANGGYRIDPHAVSEVRPAEGGVWQEKQTKTRVLSAATAFEMTDLLRSVLQPNGTGYSVQPYLRGLAAAKTGTTDTDAWMVGYTPHLVAAVWVGYDDGRPLRIADAHLAGPVWAKLMGAAQQHDPASWFQPPSGLVRRVIDPASGQLATAACRMTEADYFVSGTEPTSSCHLHAADVQSPQLGRRTRWQWWRKWLP